MNIRILWLAVASLILACGPADAVTRIEENHWGSYRSTISPSGSPLWVTFVARATAVDIASGVTFSLQERDPGGNDTIFDVALPWTAPYPAIGAEIHVLAYFQVACDHDSLEAHHVGQWFVTWCDLERGAQVRYAASGATTRIGTSEPESFEFVLVDEDGIEAPEATPEDAYSCSDVAVAETEPPLTNPYELALRGSSMASASPFVPRRDAGLQAGPAGVIQLAFDPNGERTCGQIPAGSPATLYVVARLSGPSLCGITGAEFRIEGMPAGWVATAQPAGLSVGDPLGSIGGNVVFSTCQSPEAGPVLLYTISIFATSAVTNHTIEVVARNPPTNPVFGCPLATLCDLPLYTMVCMTGGEIHVNAPASGSCALMAVEATTWSVIKSLYQ